MTPGASNTVSEGGQNQTPIRGQYLTPIDTYVESFHSRFRDECLNEHWFTSLAHAQAVIEAWRREYNEERPKKRLGGLTPAAYAQRLIKQRAAVTIGL